VLTSSLARDGEDDVLAVWLAVEGDVRVSATVTVARSDHRS
jgi:hypothetical protein